MRDYFKLIESVVDLGHVVKLPHQYSLNKEEICQDQNRRCPLEENRAPTGE
jgi:hypothetical protein